MTRTRPPRCLVFRNHSVSVSACSVLLAAAPALLIRFGAPMVAAAPILAVCGAIARTRMARRWWARSVIAGLSAGFAGIFVYALSPPVLERIGHELGWPGQSLRLWERFTWPVYAGPFTNPVFWKVFEIWDAWVRMLTRQSLISASSTLVLVLFFHFGIRSARRRNSKSRTSSKQA